MNTKRVTTVISLSPTTLGVVENAVSLLKSVKQDAFAFEFDGSIEPPASTAPTTPRLWSELGTFLAEERKRRRSELLIAVLEDPIENNWFSHAAFGKNVAWITTHDWEFYSTLPAEIFVAYEIILNTVLLQLVSTAEDEAWLMAEVIHSSETRECISDLCAYKPDISRKIRSGGICFDCQRIVESRMGSHALKAIKALLQAISEAAEPSRPGTLLRDFPVLSRMEANAMRLLDEANWRAQDERAKVEQLEFQKRELESRLKAIEEERKLLIKRARESKARIETWNRSLMSLQDVQASFEAHPAPLDPSGLADQVERRYPFPIAYCFRSMRAELNPTDRWDALFELYALIVHYVVFGLLSALRHGQAACPEELKPLIQKLKFGFAGDWGKACVALLKHSRNNDTDSFFKGFLNKVTGENLAKFEAGSRSLVQTRNSMEHGFKGDKQACQTIFERHLPHIKNMLQFIEPLTDYVLIRPVQIVDHLGGQCIYFSKILAGSDPQFLPKQMISSSVPETVCQLLSPDGGALTLHPWVHLSRCDSCLREMVFVYDAIHIKGAKEAVLLREYPSNHEQRQPALVPQVKKLLSVQA